jgi:hypothetical protein
VVKYSDNENSNKMAYNEGMRAILLHIETTRNYDKELKEYADLRLRKHLEKWKECNCKEC